MNTFLRALVFALLAGVVGLAHAQAPDMGLRDLAATQLGLESSSVNVALITSPGLAGPATDYTFKFASIPRGKTVVRGISPQHKNVAFTVSIEIWENVLVARVPVERGSPLDPNDFTTVRRDVTHVTPVRISSLSSFRTRRRIPVGRILVQDAIEPIPDVHRGDRVTLVAVSGAVRVTRTGVALKDADIGETVRIRLDRRTIVSGTVTGPHLCSVAL